MTMFEFLTQEEVGLVSNQVLLSSSSAVSATEYRSCGRAGAWGAGSELQEPASGHICTISATLGYSRLLSHHPLEARRVVARHRADVPLVLEAGRVQKEGVDRGPLPVDGLVLAAAARPLVDAVYARLATGVGAGGARGVACLDVGALSTH